MMQLRRLLAFGFLLWLASLPAAAAAPGAKSAVPKPPIASAEQRAALRELLGREIIMIAGRTLDPLPLRQLYAASDDDLLWLGREERVEALSAAFADAADDGLDLPAPLPDPFKVSTADAIERDLVLSDGALRLAAALATGRVRPQLIEEDWAIPAPSFDAAGGLARALRTGKLASWLAGLVPSDPRYLRLKAALAQYRAIAANGNWPQIKGGPTIKSGGEDERVPVIRQRLIAEGYLPADAAGDNTFDATLEAAVHVFQDQHGIVGDGAIGMRTIAAMNVSVHSRIEQIALTLERWRSLPRDLGRNYAFVNVPGESLEIFEDGAPVLEMKVVVGDPGHPTPVVTSRIAALTFNPVWRVPLSIGKNEIAPKLKHDPKYLAKNDMVMKGAYTFEQLPGPKNPLGQIKFETPNKFDVYLHDTSTHATFQRVARALSHGCVRTENARQLAAYVLDAAKWPPEEIEKAVATTVTQRVEVQRHLRVNILYFTSFVDPDGTVEFREDIYGRDQRLRQGLLGAQPTLAGNGKAKPGVG